MSRQIQIIELEKGHRDIIEKVVPVEKQDKFTIIYEPFETATLPPDVEYDLVFSSPPFF